MSATVSNCLICKTRGPKALKVVSLLDLSDARGLEGERGLGPKMLKLELEDKQTNTHTHTHTST